MYLFFFLFQTVSDEELKIALVLEKKKRFLLLETVHKSVQTLPVERDLGAITIGGMPTGVTISSGPSTSSAVPSVQGLEQRVLEAMAQLTDADKELLK